MHERICEIRTDAGLTQEKFAQRMGVSKNYVTLIETGKKRPGDRLLSDICREFHINEEWLLTGEGKKRVEFTRSQVIADFTADILKDEEESFRRRFVEAFAELNLDEWKVIEKVFDKIQQKKD